MDFELGQEERLLQDSARRMLGETCAFDRRGPLVAAGSFEPARWAAYAEMGWLMMAVPESRGGLGSGAAQTAILMEELGRSLCVEPLWAVGVLSASLLAALPASPRADALLDGLMGGEQRPVLAHGEAAARGTVAQVATRAEEAGPGRWMLHGEKTLVAGGNAATALIVSARTRGADGDAAGISLFVVDPAAAGVGNRGVRLVDNRWASHVTLDGVVVGEADLLGPLHGAHDAIDTAIAHGTLGLCAEAVGLMESAFYTTRDYLKLRQQFGVPLSSFQSVQHRLSEMLIELELARSMVFRAISFIDAEAGARNAAISSAKAHVGRSGRFVCGQCIQLSGGIGVTEEYIVGHYFKRMTLIEQALGNSHVHLQRLAERERAA